MHTVRFVLLGSDDSIIRYTVTRKTNQRRTILSTITALYLLGTFQFGLEWYMMDREFVKYGDTRDTVYHAYLNMPAWVAFMLDFCPLFSIVLADGLLMWRCFHVWNRSIRVMALPSLLMFAEIGLFIAAMVFQGRYNVSGTPLLSEQYIATINAVISAQQFVSVAASLVTTLLIVFKVHSVTRANGGSVLRFKSILDVVIQSSAVYSLAIMMQAISFVLPNAGHSDHPRVFGVEVWMTYLTALTSTLVPTLMVARIIFIPPRISTMQLDISALHFERLSTVNMQEA